MLKISSPKNKTIQGNIFIPSSKSISNRTLIIKALSKEKIILENISISDDTKVLQKAISQIENNSEEKPLTINIGLAGTSFRFLSAFLSIQKGIYILTGEKKIQERPIKPLVNSLKNIGANIEYLEKEGFAPLLITGTTLIGKEITINANISSQFITALMLIAPKIKNGLKIKLIGKITSLPYITMTQNLMNLFSVETIFKNNKITIKEQNYTKNNLKIESDWSSASYFYEIVALSKQAEIILPNYYKNSIQGDSKLVEIYKTLGVNTTFKNNEIILSKAKFKKEFFKYNFISEPDLAQAVLATCLALNIEAEVSGLETLKVKETDRIFALNKEFNKLNWELIETKKEVYSLRKKENIKKNNFEEIVFKTYEDHRMAMCLAPLSLKYDNIYIEKPEVISKSNPLFWKLLKKIGFNLK